MLKLSHITYYFSYAMGAIALTFGIVVLSGIGFANVPRQIRIAFGIVLLLWGVYRFVAAWSTYRQQKREESEE